MLLISAQFFVVLGASPKGRGSKMKLSGRGGNKGESFVKYCLKH